MTKQESWYDRYPDYRVDLVPNDQQLEARYGEVVVAASTNTLSVQETNHDPVVYFPLDDVKLQHFASTDHETFCPFKGHASYWSLTLAGDVADNVMWAYNNPFPEVAGLEGYAAFYGDRVTVSPAG